MGQPLGGHPHIVYQTEGLPANVGGDYVAGVSCHQECCIAAPLWPGSIFW
jgi:hypothetical protein